VALHRSITREEPEVREDGTTIVWIRETGELEEERCARCDEEAFSQLCHACWPTGKRHWHGRVHELEHTGRRGGLVPLCNSCGVLHAQDWTEKREGQPA
jgi:hypothetical protein